MTSYKYVTEIYKDSDFDTHVLQSPLPALVVFTAEWSGPSNELLPIVNKIGEDYQGRAKIFSIDIDDCPETTKKYSVTEAPTAIAFKGGEKTGEDAGLCSREMLIKLLGI
ncbi:thioredoxin domain-containing protein [Streptomyces sp. NPDC050625]|uniref:thioredoxin family protein n=1 Tax=Streptomyces sp. NPDC050625 TaxID=3154629 RepID=UPI003417DB4B